MFRIGLRRFRALAALALLAMLAHGLVPAGYMPAPADGGGRFLSVVLCTGWGPAEGVLDLATGEVTRHAPEEEGSSDDGSPCVFAATAQLAAPANPPSLTLLAESPEHGLVVLAKSGVVVRIAAPPPQATAPPHAV
jgi:hypothetical protein